MRRPPLWATLLFVLAGPVLEAGAGPFVLSEGWSTGSAWPAALRGAGALLIAGGVVVVVWTLRSLAVDGGGTGSPALPTQRLVVRGAYRWVRHPMYVATASAIAGQGLLLGRWVLLAGAAVYAGVLAALSRWREEPALLERYGEPYARYRAAVPGWFPARRAYDV